MRWTENGVEASIAAARTLSRQASVASMAFEAETDAPQRLRQRAVAVEDGYSLKHSGMPEEAGAALARQFGARIVDPDPTQSARPPLRTRHSHVGPVLPALGYGSSQIAELRATIERVPCDTVLLGTPVDLRHRMVIRKPVARVKEVARDTSDSSLGQLVLARLARS
jgi:predicted GTPase